MGRFYGEQIKKGKITLEDVPKLWRPMAGKWLEFVTGQEGKE